MGVKMCAMWVALGLGVVALVLAQGCPAERSLGGGLKLANSAGQATTTLGTYDSLLVGLEGELEPRSHYTFKVTPTGEEAPIVGQARLTTDGDGRLKDAFLLFDVGQGDVPPGTYDVETTGPGLNVIEPIVIEPQTEPYVYTCDANGEMKNSFAYTEIAYVAGGNFPQDETLYLWLLHDSSEYCDGDSFHGNQRPPGASSPTIAVTDANGNLPITQFMTFGVALDLGTGLDIIADFAPFEVFDKATDAVDGHGVVGLTYQGDDVGSDVDSELACKWGGIYAESFAPDEDVYLKINPPLRYTLPVRMVDKYVCDHKDEWQDGDALVDVSGGNETDGVQSGCTNEYTVLVFPAPLPSGDYDVILDINQDGLYTRGLDIVDGGSAESFGKVGFTVN